jgi:hypothetical protein
LVVVIVVAFILFDLNWHEMILHMNLNTNLVEPMLCLIKIFCCARLADCKFTTTMD